MIIADWWNFVYRDLMGENGFMMFLFGWELFILPIFFVLSVGSAVVKALLGQSE